MEIMPIVLRHNRRFWIDSAIGGERMLCPECLKEMVLVDNGDGDPVWLCRCKAVVDYDPGEGCGDGGKLEEMEIKAFESDR